MLNREIDCPVCLNIEGGSCNFSFQACYFECNVCGNYRVDPELCSHAQAGALDLRSWRLSKVQTGVLSHRIRMMTNEAQNKDSDPLLITRDVLDSLRANAVLPSPAAQAANFVRFVGDNVSGSGEAIRELPLHIHATIGALTRASAVRLIWELTERGIIRSGGTGTFGQTDPTFIILSLDGWELYEAQKRGNVEGNFGLIAMQFNERELDDFVQNVVKPTVTEIGYDLVDIRDVSRAGIIDNIMRIRIREARFVIADLTHDNNGAYWEAGYAEGLGKPVIYICKRTKFDAEKTHFDTNHCTTVPWSTDDPETFKQRLTATLRRSLDLGA